MQFFRARRLSKRPVLAVGLFLLAVSAFANETAPVVEEGGSPIVIESAEDSPWTFSFDWAHLHQSRRNPIDLHLVSSGIVNTRDLVQGDESGVQFSLERQLNESWSLQGSYLGNSWGAGTAGAHVGPGLMFTSRQGVYQSVPAIGLTGGGYRAFLNSELSDFQLNFKNKLLERLELRAGVRYLEFDDLYQILFNGVDDQDGDPLDATASWKVDNSLIGAQIGANFLLYEGKRLRVKADGSFGLFSNDAEGFHRTVQNLNGVQFTGTSGSSSRHTGSTIFELELGGDYQLTERLSLYGGYRVFWLNNIALAPEQLEQTIYATFFTPVVPMTLNNKSDQLFHGIILGAKIEF
ncbi:MAG: BBP7 family outer membrane beta-barrel protein [Verrucomicrobiales bacterium]